MIRLAFGGHMSWRFGLRHHLLVSWGHAFFAISHAPIREQGLRSVEGWTNRVHITEYNSHNLYIYIILCVCVCVFPPGTLGCQAAALKFLFFLHEKRKFHPGFKVLRARIRSPTRLQRPLEPLDDATGRKNLQKWIELVDFWWFQHGSTSWWKEVELLYWKF